MKCHQTFSILHDTIFHKSQTPLTSWFYLIFRWINTKHVEWQPFLGLFFGRHLCLVFYGG
ncbi:hypothetical protein [Spiroplasma ixodetis]|uniref:hypothetical protein n=1 Tax=Spiroplasma ixodetis TaxID=2141 RepID=UPI00333EF454